MHPIPKVAIPWHTLHIDATGKLSGKNDEKEYVFVVIDAFTKYVLLHHTLHIDTSSSIKAVKASVALFGAPTRLIADQGRCFASREFREYCDSSNIKLHLIATGSSRANGQVERVMSVLKNMLTAVETSNRSWQDALPDVQLALNCTINRVTKASPLELLIGKVARPIEIMLANNDEPEVDLGLVRNQAVENMSKASAYDKARFDSTKAKIKSFSLGDYVLLQNEERNQTKLDPKYRGPFKIIGVLDGNRYTLKALDSSRTYKYAHDRLRKVPDSEVIAVDSESVLDDHSNVDQEAMTPE
ncbi:Transposon Tf2-8 polyprotein [Eumeta japonica]|uniref:Transposon Tf2-8 polyprotein n=1 Tax=Eumeta variegata TaxID=151549 RepID=A0A4C1ZH84_EUMVA|nr:Transposon Tf2-8 polyprotein [Eumeta japonica]